MIPLKLRQELKKRMEQVFANHQYKRPAKDDEEVDPLSPMNIFTQRLPIKQEKDDTPFPFCLIKLVNGKQADLINAPYLVEVNIIVGMYELDDDNQGEDNVSLALNKILLSLQEAPIFDGAFELDMNSEITWAISEDETTQPYYFGAVSAHFNAPKIQRQDLAMGRFL